MRTIVAGSRSINIYSIVQAAIEESGFDITEIVSGHAYGIDQLGERWANENNIPIKLFLPDWNTHGKSAGMIRNRQMGDYADALILVWDGVSRGSRGMLEYAVHKKLARYVKIVKQ